MKDKNIQTAPARRYIPIKTKVILFAGVLVISLTALMVVYLQYFVRASFKEEVMANLKIVENKNMGVYDAFIDGLKTHALDWSSDNYIKDLAQTIVDPVAPALRRQAAVEDFGKYLRERKMKYDTEAIIVDLLDQNGIVVASSHDERIGVDELKEELEHQTSYFSKTITANFGETFTRSVVFEEDESPEPMFHITTRVFKTEFSADGNPIPLPAVLLVHFVSLPHLSQFLMPTEDVLQASDEKDSYAPVREFKTLENYVVNKDGVVVTKTRSIIDITRKQRITTRPVEECLVNGREMVGEYLDYRGVPVIGASVCLKEDGLVIINEIESREAYAIIDALVRKTAIFGGMILIAVALLIFFATRRLLRNLEQITFAARWFSLGVFDERATVASKDEIGQLATTFNIMLDKIEDSKKELAENLKNTEKQNKFLEQTKTATLNVLEDVQQLREQSEAQKNRLQAIISSIGEGLILVDKDYVIILANPMVGEILDLPLKDIVGKKAYEIIRIIKDGKDIPMEERPISRVFATKRGVEIKLEDNHSLRTASGKEFPVAMSAVPLIKDDVVGAVVMFRDVSSEKALDESKSSFISVASHQLRTPLTSIRWYTEMLIDEDVGALNDQQKEFAQQVYDGAARLNETVNTLLSLSRIESGKLHEDPIDIDLKSFIKNITDELAPLISQNKLSVKVDIADDMQVKADTFMLHEVVTNLIANSIRYTDVGGRIVFGCTQGENETTCVVSDNGIGIPDNQKDEVFDKFFRAGNAVKKAPDGSGLGLGLVKGFVEKWGGRVWFESTEGKGTTFHFTVPHHH